MSMYYNLIIPIVKRLHYNLKMVDVWVGVLFIVFCCFKKKKN